MPANKWLANISLEVSAFANTEGGELFLGIDEDKRSRPRVATSIDGISANLAPEQLQQLIEGNVSPYLPGIRVQRVLLSNLPDKVAFVVVIPQGNTAYQANDGRYYGRSEFEAKYLPDHEIRLRMSRGKVAQGIVLIQSIAVELGIEREAKVRAEIEGERARRVADKVAGQLEVQMRLQDGTPVFSQPEITDAMTLLSAENIPDAMTIDFVFRNNGEVTIRAPLLQIQELLDEHLFDTRAVQKTQSSRSRIELKNAIIYPGDEQEIAAARLSLTCKRETVLSAGDYTLNWRVFLDNSPPSFGDIDLATLIETERNKRRIADR